jgi:hypothetical protein
VSSQKQRFELLTNPDNASETLLIEIDHHSGDLVDYSIDDIRITSWIGDENPIIVYACDIKKVLQIKILNFAFVSEEAINDFVL